MILLWFCLLCCMCLGIFASVMWSWCLHLLSLWNVVDWFDLWADLWLALLGRGRGLALGSYLFWPSSGLLLTFKPGNTLVLPTTFMIDPLLFSFSRLYVLCALKTTTKKHKKWWCHFTLKAIPRKNQSGNLNKLCQVSQFWIYLLTIWLVEFSTSLQALFTCL